jgi:nicotinate-nucleotide adenylyltransferase
MVDTLQSFRLEDKNASLTLIMGYDAFLSLPKWHQWEKILQLANIIVINRTQFLPNTVPKTISQLLSQYEDENPLHLLNTTAGLISFFDAGNFDISSTEIREKLKENKKINDCLPIEVYQYIKLQGLYR